MSCAFLPLLKKRCYIILWWLIVAGVTLYSEIKQDSLTLSVWREIWSNKESLKWRNKVYFGIKKALNAFYALMLRGSRTLALDQTHVYNILNVSWFCMIRVDEYFESRIVHGKLSTY